VIVGGMVRVVDLSWQPELDDYVDAFRARKAGEPGRGSWRPSVLRALIAVDVVLGLVFAVTGTYEGAVYTLLLLAYLGFLFRFVGRRNRRRDTSLQLATKLWNRHEQLRTPVEATVSSEGVRISSAGESSLHTWSVILKVIESDRSMVLIVQPTKPVNLTSRLVFALGVKACLPIPKRGLADPGQLGQLRALLTDGVGGRYLSTAVGA
jgi:YcxB-like protein